LHLNRSAFVAVYFGFGLAWDGLSGFSTALPGRASAPSTPRSTSSRIASSASARLRASSRARPALISFSASMFPVPPRPAYRGGSCCAGLIAAAAAAGAPADAAAVGAAREAEPDADLGYAAAVDGDGPSEAGRASLSARSREPLI
jgi:hypothetical protein